MPSKTCTYARDAKRKCSATRGCRTSAQGGTREGLPGRSVRNARRAWNVR